MIAAEDLSKDERIVLRQLSFEQTMDIEQIINSLQQDDHILHDSLPTILDELYDKGLVTLGADFNYRLPRQRKIQHLIAALTV